MPAARPRAAGFLTTQLAYEAWTGCRNCFCETSVHGMFDLERLLVHDCTELPECRCRKEMRFARTRALPGKVETHIRVYECAECGHELRLTVWGPEAMRGD